MKKISLLITLSIAATCLFACTSKTASTTNEAKANTTQAQVNNTAPTQAPIQTAPAQQPTGDPIKDEASWPIGKFGYHEPPEEIRQDVMGYKGHYQIYFHSERYGDLTLDYDTKSGQRTLFTKGQEDPTGRLMIISEDNPISIAEALQDLKMGDSIARNFGK